MCTGADVMVVFQMYKEKKNHHSLFHFNWDMKARTVSEQNPIAEIYQFC